MMPPDTESRWKTAFKLTTPIFMGYFAAGVAYGMLATNAGMPVWFTLVMCFTVFSGTAQYAAIPFFISASGFISVLLSTLLMSLRFIFYVLNMRSALPQQPIKRLIAQAYMTDENFALLSTYPQMEREQLIFKVSLLGMLYWAFATLVGIILGDSVADYIPHLDFALPCLFAILAFEQYQSQKQWKPIFIALVSFLLAQQISEQRILLIAILIAIFIVTLLPQSFKRKETSNDHR